MIVLPASCVIPFVVNVLVTDALPAVSALLTLALFRLASALVEKVVVDAPPFSVADPDTVNAFVTFALYKVLEPLVVKDVAVIPARADKPPTLNPFVIVADDKFDAPDAENDDVESPPFMDADPATVRAFVTAALLSVDAPDVVSVAKPVLPLTVKLEAVVPASPVAPETVSELNVLDPAESTPSVDAPVAPNVPVTEALASVEAPAVSAPRVELPVTVRDPDVVVPLIPADDNVAPVAMRPVVVRPVLLMKTTSVPCTCNECLEAEGTLYHN